MAPFTAQEAAQTRQLLSTAAIERRNEVELYDAARSDDSDEDNGSDSPIFDQFYDQGGARAIIEMINFNPAQFMGIWAGFQKLILENYNVGRGRKCSHSPKDVLFMTPSVLKHGGTWDFLAKMFGQKTSTFERLIVRFIGIISEPVYEQYVTYCHKRWSMKELSDKSKLFKEYPMARYATDVPFQPSFRPSGSLEEGKKYFSGKHKLYGYKVEVSVMPNGFAICCSMHEPGSVSDLEIFREMQRFHRRAQRKKEDEATIEDSGPLQEEYPGQWDILADKGYQGAAEFCRVIHPKRKLPGAFLSPGEVAENRAISGDRFLVENFFGRMCGLWSVVGTKWKSSEGNYDAVFQTCLGLTNFHIRWRPLRAQDMTLYQQLTNRWYQIGICQLERRRRIQKRYREKRALMKRQFRASCALGLLGREPTEEI